MLQLSQIKEMRIGLLPMPVSPMMYSTMHTPAQSDLRDEDRSPTDARITNDVLQSKDEGEVEMRSEAATQLRRKSYKSYVVIIPPEDCWHQIQAIRKYVSHFLYITF